MREKEIGLERGERVRERGEEIKRDGYREKRGERGG